MAEFANIIVDISLEKLDRTFQYRIPERLREVLAPGMQVRVPFGSRGVTGYVMELTDTAEYDISRIREIKSVVQNSVAIEGQLIALAAWMRKQYGGTMNQALKTVLPVKAAKRAVEQKTVRLAVSDVEAKNQLGTYQRKHNVARARLLEALLEQGELEWHVITHKLNVSGSVVKALEEAGLVQIVSRRNYRNPVAYLEKKEYRLTLNDAQQRVVDTVMEDYDRQIYRTYLLKGVTGSGKTEVYMELIARVVSKGRQAVVLIPEIALTYQTVMRFYNRFGDKVSIINSRLSAGEKFDQFERAKAGELSVVIGPRSALFVPFPNLGLIIIDEEHETSYKSENTPRYHARETAVERARMAHASVVLGSATPSVEAYYRAKAGEYRLLTLDKRVGERRLPVCEVVDLRDEFRAGNRSILSRRLTALIEERLLKGQQTMLFINRRGIAGFVSCRACGHVIKCPHCDVSLSQHTGGRMICHYCGYEEPERAVCPSCGSRYIGGFRAGTEKIEMMVKSRFPSARVLRMDMDTTRKKDSYEAILSAFANQEADILIGTQMIVKGHDFPHVTLVGILAADMSLHVSDYHAAERTFQLLTQAAGRAGRGILPGEVVIQTYDPLHYSIATACGQDYEAFYRQEIAYRTIMSYPPVWNMLVICCAAKEEQTAAAGAMQLAEKTRAFGEAADGLYLIGPADASIAKLKDLYRKVIYLKHEKYQVLVAIKDRLEHYIWEHGIFANMNVQFDFNPMNIG